ncbi:hypothetical protein [Kitasatospora sp. MAP5-34]|uniref:hypothetical protein n=1 Tax=Kitasatospora sp. MAP5-34 TaxID=3035102 RepID=UPI0024756810|nr:hypothetical protein [Kitasatospora sp. MAP5-34]MDH6575505.1 hypothetical protein [Kitasatospora sp. MAP5-34]
MSHPLTRRIAQAALLVAAGATPFVASGSASAADLLPKSDLGAGLTQFDAPSGASTVQGAAHDLGEAAGTTGAATVQAGVPATADAAGHTVAAALPDANKTLGGVTGPAAKTAATTGTLTSVAGRLAPALLDRVGPAVAGKLTPVSGGAQRAATASNPLGSLTSGLPTAGLTSGLPSGLTGGLPGTGGLTKSVPALPSLPGTDALPLDALTGHTDSHRLGGLPALGGGDPLSSLTNVVGGLGVAGLSGAGLPI